jgi:hypothetical protein
MIRKKGNKWIFYSKDGKRKLGEHNSKEDALKQERVIYTKKGK